MSLTGFLVYYALALVVPYTIFFFFRRSTRVVFQGQVVVANVGLMPRERSATTPYDVYPVFLPDGTQMGLQISQARMRRLREIGPTAVITVQQPLIGARYISSVQLPGEEKAGPGDKRFGGLYLSSTYCILAMWAFLVVTEPNIASVLGHFGTAIVALLAAVSGWAFGGYHTEPLPAYAETRLLGMSLGKGRQSLFNGAVLAAAVTVGCIWYGGFAAAVFGLSFAFVAGQYCGMAMKSAAEPADTSP
jgi:hypothetical protein